MPRGRTIDKVKVLACYETMRDPSVTYKEAAEQHGLSLYTVQRIARGEYDDLPPLPRRERAATGTAPKKARGLRLAPEADELIDQYCQRYGTTRSKFVSDLILAFHKRMEQSNA